jgi:hypothetical protein
MNVLEDIYFDVNGIEYEVWFTTHMPTRVNSWVTNEIYFDVQNIENEVWFTPPMPTAATPTTTTPMPTRANPFWPTHADELTADNNHVIDECIGHIYSVYHEKVVAPAGYDTWTMFQDYVSSYFIAPPVVGGGVQWHVELMMI